MHVEFLSDEEIFTFRSSSWETSDDTDSNTSNSKIRKKKGKQIK